MRARAAVCASWEEPVRWTWVTSRLRIALQQSPVTQAFYVGFGVVPIPVAPPAGRRKRAALLAYPEPLGGQL
jgi:hypothetical protein